MNLPASREQRIELCMITTLDGAVDINGRSGPLGGRADQAHLMSLRSAADLVLVGAGTVRAEGYGVPSKKGLRIGIVTQSCDLDYSTALFTSGAGFIITTTTAREVPVESIRAGTSNVNFAVALAQLDAKIIHVEGGPQLNAALLEQDLVDAINLTFSPQLAGMRGLSMSQAPHIARRFKLVCVRDEDNCVFVRYERTTAV